MSKTATPAARRWTPEPHHATVDETMEWLCRNRVLQIGPVPLVMGILNVTPDSFSDGGRYVDPDVAVRRGVQMVEEGADIVDIGGESTRPGAPSVDAEEERCRVVPVVEALRRETGVCLSVDTGKAEVARAALDAGAEIINDVTALTGDRDMCEVARQTGAGVILMHMQGTPCTMQTRPHYGNVVAEVSAFLASRVEALVEQGLEEKRLAIDPGIGFGKTLTHNLQLLGHLSRIRDIGRPVVVGLSRKSILGQLTGKETEDRLAGSLAALACCTMMGIHVMRVHDVKESVDAIRVVTALSEAGKGEPGGVE